MQREVTRMDAETYGEEAHNAVSVIREELRKTQEDVKFLEEYRDMVAEKVATIEAKNAKIEAEGAVLKKRLSDLEKLWNLDGDCQKGGSP